MDTKTKRRTPPGEPAYHRLTDEKRTIIETLRKEGRSLSSIEAHFAGLTENCYNTNQSQESTCLTMLRNACCVDYWKAGNINVHVR